MKSQNSWSSLHMKQSSVKAVKMNFTLVVLLGVVLGCYNYALSVKNLEKTFDEEESLIDQFDNNKRDGENTVPELQSYTPIPGGIYMGRLPEVPKTITYNLTSYINPLATQVFIYVYITTHNLGPYHRGYYVIWTEKEELKYEQYMNIATGFPSTTINSANLWLPVSVGENAKLQIKLNFPVDTSVAYEGGLSSESKNCSFTGKSSGVFIIGYK